MRKTLKLIKYAFLIIFAFIIIIATQIGCKLAQMTPSETGPVNDQIMACKNGFVNFYIYQDDHNIFCFDAGLDSTSVMAELQKINIDPKQVKAVFLTHSDIDHVGGTPLFKNATIYFPAKEVQMINGQTRRNFMFRKRNNSIPFKVYSTLKDRDSLIFDETRIDCYEIPGHTPGSMLYLVNDSILFSGDAFLPGKNNEIEAFPYYINHDQASAERNIEIIKSMEAKLYLPGHGGAFRSNN